MNRKNQIKMARTQVPEEDQRVQTVSDLKNEEPRPQAVLRVEGKSASADGLANLYWWDPNGDASNANGSSIIASNVSGYGDGGAKEGVWRRMVQPHTELVASSNNLKITTSGGTDTISFKDDIQVERNLEVKTGYFWVKNGNNAFVSGDMHVGGSSVPSGSLDVTGGNVNITDGYIWVQNSNNAFLSGKTHIGGSTVPTNALEVSGNFTSSGWGGVNDKFSVNAPAPFGPNAVGTEELQVDGSVGADSYNFYNSNSSWNIRSSGGTGDLLIHQNFGSNFSVLDVRTRDVDVTDTTVNSEATIALVRSDSSETDKEFIDLYNNGYHTSNAVDYGLRVQKRGGGQFRPFFFEWSDANDLFAGYKLTPPNDLTTGDGAKISFNVPVEFTKSGSNPVSLVNGGNDELQVTDGSGNFRDFRVRDLTVEGTETVFDTETVSFNDNILLLNSNVGSSTSPTEDAGLKVNRGSETDATLIYDESNDYWAAGLDGSENQIWHAGSDGSGSGLDADTLDGVQLANITFSDISASRYTNSNARSAINTDSDHGSTASHNYYTDSDARSAINSDSDHGSTASHNYYTDSDAQSAVSASDVGLGNVPNTDIAYSSTIPADDFTSTEVSNLRSGKLDDGTTPWTSNNNYTDSDARSAVSANDVGLERVFNTQMNVVDTAPSSGAGQDGDVWFVV
jgi:hypothetical protein